MYSHPIVNKITYRNESESEDEEYTYCSDDQVSRVSEESIEKNSEGDFLDCDEYIDYKEDDENPYVLIQKQSKINHVIAKDDPLKDNEALLQATKNGNTNVVKNLLADGANVRMRDDEALRTASEKGHLEIVKLLLSYGANPRANDDEALKEACKACPGHVRIVKLLLAHGADVHAEDDEPLMRACEYGGTVLTEILLDHGADIMARGNNEALQKAADSNSIGTILLFTERHDFTQTELNEALIQAAINGYVNAVRLLLRFGARVEQKNDKALAWAKHWDHHRVVRILNENHEKNKGK